MLASWSWPDKESFPLKGLSNLHVPSWLPNLELLSYKHGSHCSCWPMKQTLDSTWTNLHVLCLFSPSVFHTSFLSWTDCPTCKAAPLLPQHTFLLGYCWQFVVSILLISFIGALLLFSLLIEILEGRNWAVFWFFSFSQSISSLPLRKPSPWLESDQCHELAP